jgi:cytochrome c oxidase subunit IV
MSAEQPHKSHVKEYWIIFFVLAFLTVLELIIPALKNIEYIYRASSLTLLAVGKAFIVAFFYMHLKDESKWMRFVAAIPISAAIYAAVVILESVYR